MRSMKTPSAAQKTRAEPRRAWPCARPPVTGCAAGRQAAHLRSSRCSSARARWGRATGRRRRTACCISTAPAPCARVRLRPPRARCGGARAAAAASRAPSRARPAGLRLPRRAARAALHMTGASASFRCAAALLRGVQREPGNGTLKRQCWVRVYGVGGPCLSTTNTFTPWSPDLRGRPRGAQNKHMQNVIRTLVVVGVGMILGDGILTPSVSVLSAMEGLSVAIPSVQKGTRARPATPCFLRCGDEVARASTCLRAARSGSMRSYVALPVPCLSPARVRMSPHSDRRAFLPRARSAHRRPRMRRHHHPVPDAAVWHGRHRLPL
jgi:hypothetical protein